MRMTALLATGLIAISTNAFAGDSNFYAGPFLMGGFTDSSSITRTPAQPTALRNGDDPLGPSMGGGAWVGYSLEKAIDLPLSIEFASSLRARHDQDVGFIDVTTNRLYSIKSNITTVDNMLSVIYDVPVEWGGLRPYVGGGAGVTYAYLDQKARFVNNGVAENVDEWNFAWQAQGGVKYALDEDLDLRLDYRYIDMGSVSTGTLPTGTGDAIESDLTSHDFRLGLAWAF